MSNNDNSVQEFSVITGVDSQIATQFLVATNYNLEVSCVLYLFIWYSNFFYLI